MGKNLPCDNSDNYSNQQSGYPYTLWENTSYMYNKGKLPIQYL